MARDLNTRKALQPAALILTAMLGGCASMSGFSNLSMLGVGQESSEVTPEAQAQLAVLTPEETPPVPSRRPGKRPRAKATETAQAEPQTTAAAPAAEPEKQESSGGGISLAALASLNPFSSLSSSSSSSSSTPPVAEAATTASVPGAPEAVLIDHPTVEAYSLIAQRIKYCWLNPSGPRLPNHGFHAELPAGAEIKEARMLVYEKDKDGRRGTTVFKVDITAESDGALVASQNVRLDKAMEAGFKTDLARWAKGDERCKV